jgi:DNA-binding CsgD family transcriptional regulator
VTVVFKDNQIKNGDFLFNIEAKKAINSFSLSKKAQFITDCEGRIIVTSEGALNLLQESTILTTKDNRLVLRRQDWVESFDAAIKGSVDTVLVLTDDDENETYCVQIKGQDVRWITIRPLRSSGHLDSEPSNPATIQIDFFNSFNLTASERRIASYLATNMSLEEIGKLLKIRHETVRTHKRRIFAKIGVSSTAELLALVIRALI